MLTAITERLPEVAKDVRLNLGKVLDLEQTDGLTPSQVVGCALAVAYHLSDPLIIEELEALNSDPLVSNGAKLAASLMAISNIYYRFTHLSEQPELTQIPAGLRMQGMANPGVDKLTFEMMCLAVSILNGCGACMSAHSRQLGQHGIAATALARIGRIAAIIHATNISLKL
ncbi:alkylhydroperoxidase [Legionella birminghamensis]|uniref:Alkyl hydroperoxide reductase AhpD n=1 Tax=Legionella birminghamensis TaxID=28083 RepID=A0A378IG47_9GAMM|nr:carboxymuconolactone decarboxylase family protein [Legionella birminghamensis]KTC68106.1 alkylhydroperoxidase [Legionella birminghamensis]STX31184.1 alkylhydroperoxidase [Legionella birminghamensis]